ncbi:MAG TPA: hypothetical protein VGI81_06250 [Tepidisphaeraceae bacterium]|jgi:hypothetical protein
MNSQAKLSVTFALCCGTAIGWFASLAVRMPTVSAQAANPNAEIGRYQFIVVPVNPAVSGQPTSPKTMVFDTTTGATYLLVDKTLRNSGWTRQGSPSDAR